MNNVIVRAVISEKSMTDANKGKFTFIVARGASKKAVKDAVEKLFSVHVVSVATSVVKGKTMRVGVRRNEVVKTSMKKATVLLKSGEKIDAFELGA